jgi:hypothetical protein
MDRGLASFGFEEYDVGSGIVHASPSLGPMTGAIHNITARNLHDIGTSIPDDRKFLRSWRGQLQECLGQQNARMIRFLLADASGGADVTNSDVYRRCTEVLNKYSKPTWNFASSVRDLGLVGLVADASGSGGSGGSSSLDAELGVPVETLREAQRRAVRLSVAAAQRVCAAEGRLEEKLRRLETIAGRVNDLMFLEPTAELEAMATPTRAYLDSVIDKISLEEDYCTLMESYRRFATLRGIVSLSDFQRPAAPTCTICMTKEVSQAVTPCGHTFCEDCCRGQMTSCYICRVQIRDKIRLFFS